MTISKEMMELLRVPIGSKGKVRGWPKWNKEREAAGINPDDETANMSPSEAIAYRLLREHGFVPKQTFYDTVFEGRELKNPGASLQQIMFRLKSKLPESIGSTVVSVRSQGNSGYVLAALGKEQETIEKYRREEEARLMATAASQAAIRASKTVTGQIEALFTLGKDVTTDDIFNAVFEGKTTQNNQTRISRALRILEERLKEKGQTIVSGARNGRKVYVSVRVEDAEKVKDELAKKRAAGRTPKKRITKTDGTIERRLRTEKAALSMSPPEIILEEDVEVNIYPLDNSGEEDGTEATPNHRLSFLDSGMRNKKMPPEEIRATWQRIAWDTTEMFLSRMIFFGISGEKISLEKNLEVILDASLPKERLEMFKKSTTISLPDLINEIRRTIEEAWTQTITPEQAESAYMDRKYVRILRHRNTLKKQNASIESVLKSLYEHFGLDIPAEYERAVSPYEETLPSKFRSRPPSHGYKRLD